MQQHQLKYVIKQFVFVGQIIVLLFPNQQTLQIHQRGILGLTWCPSDTDLMVSCAKDNKILCWNPNAEHQGDEILSEVASPIQWYSDVQWCPRE